MSEQGGKPFEGIRGIGGTFPELHSKGRPVATHSCQAFVTNLQIFLAQRASAQIFMQLSHEAQPSKTEF